MLKENCPEQNDLKLFRRGECSPEQAGKLEVHLSGCTECRQELSSTFFESVAEVKSFDVPESLVEKAKSLYEVETPPEKQKVSRGTSPVPWYRQNFVQVAFAASFIAVFGVFGFYLLQGPDQPLTDDVFRDGSSTANSVQLLLPENNSEISGEKIEFSWSKPDEAKNYTLVLSDEKGDIIWEIKTEKPSFTGSVAELKLVKGKHYFWHVKIRANDGTSVESERRKLFSK